MGSSQNGVLAMEVNQRFPFLNWDEKGDTWTPQYLWDTILVETTNFVVVPTRGSLVAGWILILPKIRCLSLAHLSEEYFDELETLFDSLCHTIKIQFSSDIVAWENGAASLGQAIGCGVDQAHMHIVPITVHLRKGAEQLLGRPLIWDRIHTLSNLRNTYQSGRTYLFVQEANGERYISLNPNIPSQMLRRVIAEHIGQPNQFDWRHYSGTDAIRDTLSRFSSSLSI